MRILILLSFLFCGSAHAAFSQLNALSWAKADGTDQTANMQLAVNAAVTAGQPLYVPPGIVYSHHLLTNTETLLMEDDTSIGSKTLHGTLSVTSPALGSLPGIETTGWIKSTNLFNGSLNARGFGAVGNGVTDDMEVLQRAVDTVTSANGELFLGSGRYMLSGSLTFSNACRVKGVGAVVLVPASVPAFSLSNFEGGVIEGIEFVAQNHSSGSPAIAIYGANDNLSDMQVLNNRFTRCRLMLRDSAIFDTVAGNTTIKVIGNTWDGNWGMDSFVSDTSQCIDLRGAQSVLINNNIFDVTDEQRFAHLSSCYDVSVNDNTFRSLSSTNADVGIDFFADCRKISFADNKFTMTNTTAQVVIYGKSSGMGPEGMIESQHTQVDISNNTIDFSSDSANAIPIAVYGPWGQPDETLSESTINVTENQITRRVPNSSNPGILVRGFSSANVNLNTVAGTNSQAFLHSVEVDNCETANIIGNIIDQGRITGQGVSYSPQAIQYEKLPVNFTISYNTIKSFKQLGGIWISQCTNLANFTAIGNNIWTAPSSSSSSGLIHLYQSPGITNVVVIGTTGFSDNGTHYTLEASTTVANPTVVGNFWQAVGEVYSVVPATTNIVIDFKKPQFQTTFYLNDTTNANLHFSATNCLPGKYPVLYRLQAGATNRNITFDGSFVLSHGYPTMVSSNRTLTLEFWSFSTNCGSANVTVRPMGQNADEAPVNYRNLTVNKITRPDSSAIVSFNSDNAFGSITPFQHASTNVGGVGWVASTGTMGFIARDLGTRTWSVDNSGNSTAAGYLAAMSDLYLFTNNKQIYGRNAANSAYIPLIKVGADDAIRIGSATDKTSVDYALSVGWGGAGRTDANGGQVMLDVNGRITSVQTAGTLTSDDQSMTVSMNHLLLASDDATPANRTFTLNNSGVYGQHLYLILTAGTAQLVDDSAITGGTGTVKLSANWEPEAWDSLHLYCDGTNWVEIGRSNN